MKELLVNLNKDKSLESRLRVSAELAKQFDADVTGLFVRRFITFEIFSPHATHDTYAEFDREQTELSREVKLYVQQYANLFTREVEFKDSVGDESQELVNMSGAFDLLVTGQMDDLHDIGNVPVDVVLGCGRPVLVVPVLPSDATIGHSVLVAWNGTREATRALHDAMPILKKAGYVNVVVFTPQNKTEDVVDISKLLTNHGVTYDISHSTASDDAIPGKLSDFIGHFDSDLLVMGAYGHSRLREFVLGGVTKSMLETSNIPLFISH